MTVFSRPGSAGALMSYESRYQNFIGGQWVAPVHGRYFENPTPVTGQPFCEVPAPTRPTSTRRSTPRTRRRRGGARPHRPNGRRSST